MTDRSRRDPTELSPADAVERYLRRRKPDATDRSIQGWRYRLKLFVDWCQTVDIHEIGDLQGWDIDEYYEHRSATIAGSTLEGEMWTLKMFCEFLEDLDAVEPGLADAVRIPDLDEDDRSSDTKLRTDAALTLLRYYRHSDDYGTRQHAFLELAWVTGARLGGIRALDRRDVNLDDNPYLDFRHRPGTDTPLKNKYDGERSVGLKTPVADALQAYRDHNRYDVHDDHGRQPYLASTRGRPGENTIRVWSYLATLPCIHSPCPHGKERPTCQWTEYAHASKCPSSRSPHQIRTGAVTWMLNRGWEPEDVAERVNASVKTIEQHYDKADREERRQRRRDRMERRRDHLDQLAIDSEDHT